MTGRRAEDGTMDRTQSWFSSFATFGGLALLTLGLWASQASATTSMTLEYGPAGQTRTVWSDQDMVGTQLTNNTWEFIGSRSFAMGGSEEIDMTWNFTTNADPFVDGTYSFTNNTGVVQELVLTYSVSVVPSLPTATGGATVIGILTTGSAGGTLGHVTPASGTPPSMYSALVDGSVFQTLLDFDSSVSLSSFGSDTTGAQSFGLPGLTKPVPGGVSTSIGSRLSFSVTPGASVAFTSRFEVVPEPSTALLLGVGLIALRVGRRRSASRVH